MFDSSAVAKCTLMFYVLGSYEENKTKRKNNMWIGRLEYRSYQVQHPSYMTCFSLAVLTLLGDLLPYSEARSDSRVAGRQPAVESPLARQLGTLCQWKGALVSVRKSVTHSSDPVLVSSR